MPAFLSPATAFAQSPSPSVSISPELEKATQSLTDYFGEKALARPEGATYEMFADVAPPMRYTTTAFRDYPLVLGIPGALRKARLVSDGSCINARAESKMWHDHGLPVTFFVGKDNGTTFGLDKRRLMHPQPAEGYVPVYRIDTSHEDTTYTQEAFVPWREPYIKYAGVMMRFATAGKAGTVRAALDEPKTPDGTTGTKVGRNYVCDAGGRGLVWFSDEWKWDAEQRSLIATVSKSAPATLVIFTDPLFITPEPVSAAMYDAERVQCIAQWKAILARGTQLDVPEPLVNDAWRAQLLGSYMLLKGDDLNYSAGNNYEKLYAAEAGDAVRALMLFGQLEDGLRMTPPVMDYWRNELTFHQAAFALQAFSHAFWLTRDEDFVRDQRPRWERDAREILDGREKDSGLLPRERYAGDIPKHVYSLNSNANCWRGLRDLAAVLKECGYTSESEVIASEAVKFRRAIIDAVEKSVYRDFKPPFVPIALFGEEKPYERLTADRDGSYYDLMAPYVLGSEVFGPGAELETNLIDTLQQRGGLYMGLIRTFSRQTTYATPEGFNNLYGLRYTQTILRRDDADRAVVSFYGKLAQAVTPGTFYSGEAAGIVPNDEFGRAFYLPPNSSANAFFLWMLRYLIVQDWDLNDDGKPETLRLMFATPRHWLRDGANLTLERAPTAFGEISLNVESRIANGEVVANYSAPPRKPRKTLFRLRLPTGFKVASVDVGAQSYPADHTGAVDISELSGDSILKFRVLKSGNQP